MLVPPPQRRRPDNQEPSPEREAQKRFITFEEGSNRASYPILEGKVTKQGIDELYLDGVRFEKKKKISRVSTAEQVTSLQNDRSKLNFSNTYPFGEVIAFTIADNSSKTPESPPEFCGCLLGVVDSRRFCVNCWSGVRSEMRE